MSLPGGKSGLVHISEVAAAFVSDVHDYLTEGQEVTVKILSVSPEGKINLSVKQTLPKPERPERPTRCEPAPRRAAQPAPVPAEPAEQTFEDKLKQFMQESDSRMAGNRLYSDRTRGRRRGSGRG